MICKNYGKCQTPEIQLTAASTSDLAGPVAASYTTQLNNTMGKLGNPPRATQHTRHTEQRTVSYTATQRVGRVSWDSEVEHDGIQRDTGKDKALFIQPSDQAAIESHWARSVTFRRVPRVQYVRDSVLHQQTRWK